MNIQEFFDRKEQVKEAQKKLDQTIVMLTGNFEDNFYFKVNKKQTITNDKLNCILTVSFFLPQLKAANEKKVTEIIFLSHLNFNKNHALQLTDFTGFKVTVKERELSQSRALLMMYPEIKPDDFPQTDTSYVFYKGLVIMEKESINKIKFIDFCKQKQNHISPVIKTIEAHNQGCNTHHTLTPKEHAVIMKRFNHALDNLTKSIENKKIASSLIENFDLLLETCATIDKKVLHNSLNSSLLPKNDPRLGMKI